ncbi:unnamed protein product, partial [Coregonus sp. 'balchen']
GDLTTSSAVPTTIDITTPTTAAPTSNYWSPYLYHYHQYQSPFYHHNHSFDSTPQYYTTIPNPGSHIQTPLYNTTPLYLTLDLTFTVHTTTLLYLTLDLTFTVQTTTLLYLTLDVTFTVHNTIPWISHSEWNFCNSTITYGLSFPRTTVGWSAYSEQLCGEETTSAGLPEASARCLNDTGSPMFGPPQELQCELTLSGIQGNIYSSSGDLAQLAFSTQILTSQPERLSADNITTAAQIANTLLQSVNITEPNLVVQSVQVPSDTVGIQFSALTGSSGNFVADRINLNTNTSELIADKGGATDVQIVIKFTPVLRNKNTNYSIGFVLYQNYRFFRSRTFTAASGTSRRVISANLGQVSGLHVEMLFKPTSFRRDFKYAEALNWVTILGCSMSIIGLSLTITFQIAT